MFYIFACLLSHDVRKPGDEERKQYKQAHTRRWKTELKHVLQLRKASSGAKGKHLSGKSRRGFLWKGVYHFLLLYDKKKQAS